MFVKVCGHHQLDKFYQPDIRKEALDYDKYAVGIFKRYEEDFFQLDLVGHAIVELSGLLNQFLKTDVGNGICVEIIGKRKCEVGLVVPAKLSARTKCSQMGKVLDEQLLIPFILFIEGDRKK